MSSIFKFKTDVHRGLIHAGLDTIQDFLCNLGMKPHMHLVEISIFSLNHVAPDLSKLLRTFVKPHCKYIRCKNYTKSKNFMMLEEVVHNFGNSDNDMIK